MALYFKNIESVKGKSLITYTYKPNWFMRLLGEEEGERQYIGSFLTWYSYPDLIEQDWDTCHMLERRYEKEKLKWRLKQ